MVQKRFKFPDGSVELYAEKVNNRGLCAIAQAESLRYKLLGGLAVRRYIPMPHRACLCALLRAGAHHQLVLMLGCGVDLLSSKAHSFACCLPLQTRLLTLLRVWRIFW